MAPFSANFDYRSQIIDNCEFFVAKYDIVSVITVRDPSGLFKAYAIRSNQDSRDVLLASEPSDVVLKAISSLHAKSCEAAHHYIATNGFSHPPDPKKTRFDEEDERDEDNDDNDDAASFVSGHSASSTAALSYWGSSDDEAATTPASSADPHASDRRRGSGNEKGNNNVNNTSRRRSSKPPTSNKQQQTRESVSFPTEPYDTEEDEEEHQIQPGPHVQPPHLHQQHLPPRVRLLSPVRSATSSAANTSTSYRPPPPPPGWTGPQHMPMPPPPPAARAIPIPTPQSSSHHQQQPAGLSHYYHPHHRPSPPGQPIPPPLPPSAGLVSIPTAQPKTGVTTGAEASPLNYVGPMRMAPTYKASMPNLSQHRNSTSSLAPTTTTTIPPHYPQQQHFSPNPNTTTTTTPPSFAGGPPPPPLPQPQPSQRVYDVRLTIRFGRGEQRILESCRASVRALQDAAVAYVRAHAASFGSSVVTGADLQASVRSAFFGPSEAYDMSTYRGDDLSRLFGALSAGGGIPRFEVEVEEVVD